MTKSRRSIRGTPPPPRPRDDAAPNPRADGGAVATGAVAATDHDDVDYLEREMNIFSPSTPFMPDHLRIVWTMFAAWTLVVFGPVTATGLAPDAMTSITVLGFPLHYALTAIGAALAGTPLVFAVTIAVSSVTDEPDEEIKRIVRQCHSPEPMGQQQSAEDIVATDGGRGDPVTDGGRAQASTTDQNDETEV